MRLIGLLALNLMLPFQSWADRFNSGGIVSVASGLSPTSNSVEDLRCEGRTASSSKKSRSDLVQLVQLRAAQAIERDIQDIEKSGVASRAFPSQGAESQELDRARRNQAIAGSIFVRKTDWDPCKGDSPFELRIGGKRNGTDLSRGANQGLKAANESQDPKFIEAIAKKGIKTFQQRLKELEESRAKLAPGRELRKTPGLGTCAETTIGSHQLDAIRTAYLIDANAAALEYLNKLRDQARSEVAKTHPWILKQAQNPEKRREILQAEYLKELKQSANYFRKADADPESAKALSLYRKVVRQVIQDNPDRAAELRNAADDMACELEREARTRGLITTTTGLAVIGCTGVAFFAPPAGAGCFYATSALHLNTTSLQYLASSDVANATSHGKHLEDHEATRASQTHKEAATDAALDAALTGGPLVTQAIKAITTPTISNLNRARTKDGMHKYAASAADESAATIDAAKTRQATRSFPEGATEEYVKEAIFAAKYAGFKTDGLEEAIRAGKPFELVSDGTAKSGPGQWLANRAERHGIRAIVDDSKFVGDAKHATAFADQETIFFRSDTLKNFSTSDGLVAHEIQHATNIVLCNKYGGNYCSRLMVIAAGEGELPSPGLHSIYKKAFRADEYEGHRVHLTKMNPLTEWKSPSDVTVFAKEQASHLSRVSDDVQKIPSNKFRAYSRGEFIGLRYKHATGTYVEVRIPVSRNLTAGADARNYAVEMIQKRLRFLNARPHAN